jgi:hypothetical protein
MRGKADVVERLQSGLAWRVLRVRLAGYLSTPISFGRMDEAGAGSYDKSKFQSGVNATVSTMVMIVRRPIWFTRRPRVRGRARLQASTTADESCRAVEAESASFLRL